MILTTSVIKTRRLLDDGRPALYLIRLRADNKEANTRISATIFLDTKLQEVHVQSGLMNISGSVIQTLGFTVTRPGKPFPIDINLENCDGTAGLPAITDFSNGFEETQYYLSEAQVLGVLKLVNDQFPQTTPAAANAPAGGI